MGGKLREEQGGALIVALLVMAIMMLLGTAMIATAQDSVVRTMWDRTSSQSFHAAEAGFDQAMFMARNSTLTPGTVTGKTRDAEYQVTVTGMTTGGAGEFMFQIKSVGAAPSFADPRAKRAIQSQVAALSPYSMFFASVSAGETIEGNATINGAFYTRDLFSLGGTGASAGKFTGGPLFIKDLAGTSSPTGDLELQGNATIGSAADPVYLFVDGQIIGNPGNVFSKGTFTDVPDLNFPTLTITDIVDKYRPMADEVIDTDLTKTGTTDLYLRKQSPPAGALGGIPYTSPGGHLKIEYLNAAKTEALLTVNGTVYVDGDVVVGGTGGGSAVTTYFAGKGTIVAYGEVEITGNFLPSGGVGSFPGTNCLGFITADEAEVEGGPGDKVYAVVYSSGVMEFERQVEFHGAALSQKMEFENNPQLFLDPNVAGNLPPNMPSPEAQVSVAGWNEVKP